MKYKDKYDSLLKKEEEDIKNKLNINYTKYDNGYYLGTSDNYHMIFVKVVDKNIKSLSIHPNCVYITPESISNCKNLTDIVIPESVRYIANFAFLGCLNLRKVEVLSQTTGFDYKIFKGCNNLNNNIIHNGKKIYNREVMGFNYKSIIRQTTIYDNAYYMGTKENPYLVFIEPLNNSIESITLHKECLILASLYNCKRLKKVKFNDKLLVLGWGAFMGCESLTSITLPSSLIKIDTYAFFECYKLKHINIPKNIHIIREGTFVNCHELEIELEANDCIVDKKAFDDPYKIQVMDKYKIC